MFANPPSFFSNPIITLKTILGFAGLPGGYPAEDIERLKRGFSVFKTEGGYMQIHATKPQVINILERIMRSVYLITSFAGV